MIKYYYNVFVLIILQLKKMIIIFHIQLHIHKFNQKIDLLPDSITKVLFGYYFNQPVDHLPSTIKKLVLAKHLIKKLIFCPYH